MKYVFIIFLFSFKVIANEELSAPIPLIESMRFKIDTQEDRTGNFRKGGIEYSLRFYPDNINETKLKNKLYKLQENKLKYLKENSSTQQNKKLIENYINLKHLWNISNELKQLKNLYQDKVKVLKSFSRQGLVKYEKISTATLKLNEIKTDELNVSNTITKLEQGLLEANADINLENIKKRDLGTFFKEIEKILSEESFVPVDIKYEMQSLESQKIKYELEREQKNKILDHIELSLDTSYDEQSDPKEDNRIGIGLSFNIPSLGSSKRLDTNEKLIDAIESRNEFKQKNMELRSQYQEIKNELKSNIRLIKMNIDSKVDTNAKKMLSVLSKRKGDSPLDKLELKEAIVNYKMKHHELNNKILALYTELLAMRGYLSSEKVRDYFLVSNIKGVRL